MTWLHPSGVDRCPVRVNLYARQKAVENSDAIQTYFPLKPDIQLWLFQLETRYVLHLLIKSYTNVLWRFEKWRKVNDLPEEDCFSKLAISMSFTFDTLCK